MAKQLGFLNLDNVSNLFRDGEEIRSPGLVKTFSNFNKARARLLRLGKHKSNEEFAAKQDISANRKRDLEDLNLPVNRPKRCFCNKPESQSKWRSRINDIGSMARLALGKNNDAVITRQADIRNTRHQSRMSNPQTENSTIVEELNVLGDTERSPQTSFRICKTSHNQSKLSSIQSENGAVVYPEEFNSLLNGDQISENISGISKANEISCETENPEYDATSRTPEKRESLKERKSSIKSQRGSLPEAVKSIESIGEIDTEAMSHKSEDLIETLGVIEELEELETASIPVKVSSKIDEGVQPIVDFGTVIEQKFEVANISRDTFYNMKREKNVERIIRIDHKTSPPEAEDLSAPPAIQSDSREEWTDIPVPVMNEIRRVTKPKRSHICSKACPCEFSQELINIYHEAKLLSEVANKIGEERNHCKFRMTSSEIDFFKGDNKMCNVMIGETRNRRAEMRELMDMWQEANEKLKIRTKETVAIAENIEKTGKRMEEIEYLLKDWLPGGRMEKLRKVQRAAEKRNQERMEMLEDETRIICQKKIEDIIKKREARQVEEKLREEKRKNQRQKDTLSLQNATKLLQKYIDERKSLLI